MSGANLDAPRIDQQAYTPGVVPAGDAYDKHADTSSENLYKATDETRNKSGK